ncbi:unnamed protein product [Symbiodinium microadriaticum]|nr:unnamed protein product [Symbiodinium microadriaticum]
MLAADKLELTSLIKKSATDLKGKEVELSKSNFEAVGTQAAVLAGFAVCMIAAFTASLTPLVKIDFPDDVNPLSSSLYYFFAVVNLVGNIACVASVACVNIMGTSLGLRGPDGSMLQAADGMHKQRERIFWAFTTALVGCALATLVLAWLKMQPVTAALCTAVVLYGVASGVKVTLHVQNLFQYKETESGKVDDVLSSETVGPESFVRQLGVDSDTLIQLLAKIRRRRQVLLLVALARRDGLNSMVVRRQAAGTPEVIFRTSSVLLAGGQ